ncbi:hypothetical protein C2G38_705171 [Gigaspora rosea]|uniref:Serine-threonine/tyrosine-protein kinase catalytic domain-containing protein n=1 Tax=Gigaspora rosea TaxID=44941 RepID=A0A397VQN9_9GLOM|nr:hypothetical protein C2G38_705171 [Gigaspora rosea]
MWEVLYGKSVTRDQKPEPWQICVGNLRPNIIEGTESCYVNFMKKCWEPKPENRPSSREVYETFTRWKNDKKIQLELSESDKKINQIMNLDNNYDEIYEYSTYTVHEKNLTLF